MPLQGGNLFAALSQEQSDDEEEGEDEEEAEKSRKPSKTDKNKKNKVCSSHLIHSSVAFMYM